VIAALCSVALKAAKRDSPIDLNFAVICFNIKVFFHISKQTQFASVKEFIIFDICIIRYKMIG